MNFKDLWKYALVVVAMVLAACGGLEQNSERNAAAGNIAESAGQPVVQPVQVSMIIGPQLVDCVGEGPQQCMQVKFNPDEEWQFFYNQIEGFDFQPGYRYTLLVEQLDVQNPPTGGSSLRYVLLDVLEKVEELKVNAGELAGTTWVLDGLGELAQPQGVLEKVIVSLEYDPELGRLSGSAGCNSYFGEVKIDPDQLTFAVGPLGTTRMACSEQVMAQEAAFLGLLGRVTHFAIQDGRLLLFSDSDEVLTFSPGNPPASRQ
jgi:heat shock protein HslJ